MIILCEMTLSLLTNFYRKYFLHINLYLPERLQTFYPSWSFPPPILLTISFHKEANVHKEATFYSYLKVLVLRHALKTLSHFKITCIHLKLYSGAFIFLFFNT